MALNGEPLVIRVDGGAKNGLGHVMRCTALASAWRESGGSVVAVTEDASGPAGDQLRLASIEVATASAPRASIFDAARLCRVASDAEARWVVIDGYEFGSNYLESVKSCGFGLLYLDDLGHIESNCADFILNSGVNARRQSYYERTNSATLLLGPQYAPLRRQFRDRGRHTRSVSSTPHNLLISLGGGHSGAAALRVIRALNHLSQEDIEVILVLGAASEGITAVKKAVRACKRDVDLRFNVVDMCSLMHWADIAVAGAGTTSYELAFVGLPSVVVELARNQEESGRALSELGVVWNLGRIEQLSENDIGEALGILMRDAAWRQRMHEAGVALVDALGAYRVSLRIKTSDVKLRRVRPDDCAVLWSWVNDPATRRWSFSSGPISWETHVRWFQNMIRNHDSLLLLAEVEGGRPIGEVRFDRNSESEATISISVDAALRGRGYGASIVLSAVEEVFRAWPVSRVTALIRPGNGASERTFLMAGFRKLGTRAVGHMSAECYIRDRGPWDPAHGDSHFALAIPEARTAALPSKTSAP